MSRTDKSYVYVLGYPCRACRRAAFFLRRRPASPRPEELYHHAYLIPAICKGSEVKACQWCSEQIDESFDLGLVGFFEQYTGEPNNVRLWLGEGRSP